MVDSFDQILERESILREFWDAQTIDVPSVRGLVFGNDNGAEPDDDADGRGAGVGEGKPSDFVTSPAHWAYMKMVTLVNSALVQLEAWAWSCPCHPLDSMGLKPKATWQQRSAAYKRMSPMAYASTCAMRGRRAAELAAGYFKTIIRRVVAWAQSKVLGVTRGLAEADRLRILEDFERAIEHLTYIICLKLAFYLNVPQKFLVLGHIDEEVARAGCIEAFSMLMAAVQRGSVSLMSLPRVVRRMCFPSADGNNALFEQFRDFRQGRPISELPDLWIVRCKFRLVPTMETVVEAVHATCKHEGSTRHRVSGATLSLASRSPEIEDRIEREPIFLHKLAVKCQQTRQMKNLLHALNLTVHPSILAVLDSANGNGGEDDAVGFNIEQLFEMRMPSEISTVALGRSQGTNNTWALNNKIILIGPRAHTMIFTRPVFPH